MGCICKTGCRLPVLTPLPAGMTAFSRWMGTPLCQYPARVAVCQGTLFKNAALCQTRSRWRSCRSSTRVDNREKTREALQACPFRAGQEANPTSTGSPQRLFSSVWGGLKRGDRDSMDPLRSFERWPQPVLFVPVLWRTRRDPLR
jgi:hypothetical protein